MDEIKLMDLDGKIFYEGDVEDYSEISYAVEVYLSTLTHEEIKERYDIDMAEEIERCKNEALTAQDSYTWEEAEKITMNEFDKIGIHHDSFTGRMMDYYYEIHGKFEL